MKTVIYIMLSLLCMSCRGQNTQSGEKNKKVKEMVPIDTLSLLSLKNKQYGRINYKVLRLSDLDSEGYQIKSTRRIELVKENKTVASILLPIPDEEVKNFSVSKIEETQKGFKIVVDWGGGNYFYGRESLLSD